MYHVLENGEPAAIEKDALWYNNKFHTFEDARAYLHDWIGSFDCLPPNYKGEKFDYSGEKTIVEIVERNN